MRGGIFLKKCHSKAVVSRDSNCGTAVALAKYPPRLIPRWFAVFCVCATALAQIPGTAAGKPGNAPATSATSSPAPGIRGVLKLDGPWLFQIGDDPQWTEPGFNDASWQAVTLDQPLTSQGVDSYSGYAWYRFHIDAQRLSEFANVSSGKQPVLLITPNSVGQIAVYVNGVYAGHTRGMSESPVMYMSPPFAVPVSASGGMVIAIRSWAGPDTTINRGLLDKVELGLQPDIADRLSMAEARRWDQDAISPIVVTFLFLCVAGLGAALYWAQRNHSEYLWLALLCLSAAAEAMGDAAFGLARISLPVYEVIGVWTGRIFMAVTLEFILRFTGGESRRVVRGVQVSVLLLAPVYLLHLGQVYEVLSVSAEIVFCALVCVLLFRGWRRGRGEAGIMLLPFFLAAIADSADTFLQYAAYHHWIPEQFGMYRFHVGPIEFGIGTVAYTVFLGSLVAVILYRFIRVSEVEQRNDAEISAARSVQALLIPTQLPSNRNFMLESAYLPVNGVGGDFFQVLPLKDDSFLIVVGDVSGKGLQAAMNSSTLVGALRNELSHDPATVLDHLNHVLLGAVSSPGAVPDLDTPPCFATCLCARIYPDGALTIANAGHLSPYRDGRELELPPGLPLGVVADTHYEKAAFQLSQGDRLVFLSDGVVEARDQHGELFGFERTQQVSHESARYIAQTARHFGQTDDITVVSLYLASPSAKHNSDGVMRKS